ncbi:MAG: hypothetical protein M0Q44_22000 [Methylobacter sp.]|nr:hypothetical protein [Methylobacter sp.]
MCRMLFCRAVKLIILSRSLQSARLRRFYDSVALQNRRVSRWLTALNLSIAGAGHARDKPRKIS